MRICNYVSNIFRIAIRIAYCPVMTMFDYIILEKQTVKDQSHHFHTIEFLEIVFHLNLYNITIAVLIYIK